MHNISIPVLTDLAFGFFSIATACIILFYRKNFSLYAGIAILLFAEGIISCSSGIMNMSNNPILFKFYFLGRSLAPIFLLLFSEYILKINYKIGIKLFAFLATVIIGIISFFQRDASNYFYSTASDFFLVTMIFTVLAHILFSLLKEKDLLLRRYLLISLSAFGIILTNELLKRFTNIPYASFSEGISAFALTHVVIIIITSGGFSRMEQKIPKLLYITLISFILPCSQKFLYPEISSEYLFVLFILSSTLLSGFYMFGEVSKNPKELRSAFLISRLLSSPLQDKESFLKALKQWREVKELHVIEHSEVEGSAANLDLLFQKTGRVIHKYQMPELLKALDYNPSFISGMEIAQYYFKKLDCHSLFQLSDKEDFLAVKYIEGLNPALYVNELSIMSKIVFSISALKKNN